MPNPKDTKKISNFLVLLSTTISIFTKKACDLYKEPHLDFVYELSKEPRGISIGTMKSGIFSKTQYLNIKVATSHGPVAERHIKLT